MDLRPARQRLAALLRGPEDALDLALAALLIAVEDDQDAAIEPALAELDRLAAALPEEIASLAPWAQLEALSRHLYGDAGFRGNAEDYYDPGNSLLTRVLARRTGIPLTLALVAMEVARRRGIRLLPIGLPGHLVVRHSDDSNAYLDPFNGDVMDEYECLEAVLTEQRLPRVSAGMLAPLRPRAVLRRLLNNLKSAYLRRDPQAAIAAAERILLLYPDAADEWRDKGMLLFALGRRTEALMALDRYLTMAPQATDADDVRARLARLQQEVAGQN